MRRGLAMLVAVLLVGVGWFVRSGRDDSGDGDSGPAIVCDTALADTCRRLDGVVIVEASSTTFTRLSSGADLGADAWVTFSPWPEMLGDELDRARRTTPFTSSRSIGASPVVWAMWIDRAAVLTDACGEAIDWDCATAATTWSAIGGDARWGPIELAHADPGGDGTGVALLAEVSQARLGASFTGTQVRSADFTNWLRRVVAFVPDYAPPQGSPLAAMLQVGPAGVDGVTAPEAQVRQALASATARADEITVVPAAPDAVVEVVVLALEADVDGVADTLAEVLQSAGWQPGTSTADGSSLTGGTLIALWDQWQEITR